MAFTIALAPLIKMSQRFLDGFVFLKLDHRIFFVLNDSCTNLYKLKMVIFPSIFRFKMASLSAVTVLFLSAFAVSINIIHGKLIRPSNLLS